MRRSIFPLLFLIVVLGGCSDDAPASAGDPNPSSGASEVVVDENGDPVATASTAPQIPLIGRVLNSAGLPLSGAVVSVSGATALTGSDGFYNLDAPASGLVTAEKPGWVSSEAPWDGGTTPVEIRLKPITVRALRVAANAAGDPAQFQQLLDLADETAVNALVFDTKTEGGLVLYDTGVALAHEMGAVRDTYDPVELIAKAKEHGLYTITRIVSFDDAIKGDKYPSHAIAGRWIDPRIRDAWTYNLDLAVEACELGFDEIQLDYVRFPSGDAVKISGQLDMSQAERVGAVAAYVAEARSLLHPLGCSLSADIFAIVVSASNDQGIGQRPEELSAHLDALSPMIYPSHYSNGWLGYDDPNEHPYDVTADAIDDSMLRMEPGTELRPWLQSFWWTSEQIRRSIQAAEDRGVGWMLWNIESNYSRSSLPTDAELEG
ncbi:MAG TPA: putative glycoside hydrolase [Acidimicrobiia bacterium]